MMILSYRFENLLFSNLSFGVESICAETDELKPEVLEYYYEYAEACAERDRWAKQKFVEFVEAMPKYLWIDNLDGTLTWPSTLEVSKNENGSWTLRLERLDGKVDIAVVDNGVIVEIIAEQSLLLDLAADGMVSFCTAAHDAVENQNVQPLKKRPKKSLLKKKYQEPARYIRPSARTWLRRKGGDRPWQP